MPHSHCGALAWLGNPLEISRLRCRSKSSWPLLSFRLRRAGRGAHVERACRGGRVGPWRMVSASSADDAPGGVLLGGRARPCKGVGVGRACGARRLSPPQ